MELKTYLIILWRRKWVIILTTIVAAIVSIVSTFLMTPKYEASTLLRVTTTTTGSADYGATLYAERLMATYREIILSKPTLDEVTELLGLNQRPDVSVNIKPKTELMEIVVEHDDPAPAAEIANTLAELSIAQTREIRDFRTHPISVLNAAVAPQDPFSPNLKLNIVLALMAGLAGGFALVFLFENLDTTLHTTEEIETATELPTIAQIPQAKKRHSSNLFTDSSPQGEAFRRLRTYLFNLNNNTPLRTLLFTSAISGEGKSTIVANLAYVLAQSGQRVIVVDGDMRLPSLHKFFGLPNKSGLSSLLMHKATLDKAMQDTEVPGLKVLTGGPTLTSSTPAELVELPEMTSLLDELIQRFDIVLVDSPAILAVADAAALASSVDGVLLVVGQTQVQREDIQAVRQQLAIGNVELLGTVINRTEQIYDYSSYAQLKSLVKEEIFAEEKSTQQAKNKLAKQVSAAKLRYRTLIKNLK